MVKWECGCACQKSGEKLLDITIEKAGLSVQKLVRVVEQKVRIGAKVVEDGVQVTDGRSAERVFQWLSVLQELEVRGREFPQLGRR